MGFHAETGLGLASDLITRAAELDAIGEYEQSVELLGEIWTDKSELPDLTDFPTPIAAEFMLRCGASIGFLGSFRQTRNSQEISKNLLTDARNKFEQLFNNPKIAECENYLALAYWRTGEYDEAMVWIQQSLSRNISATHQVRLHSHIIKTIILFVQEKYVDVISYLKSVQKDFDSAKFLWKGCFCTNIGLAYKNTGKFEEALRYLNFARFAHQKSKHRIYLATVENNLAMLYKLQNDFPNALKSADNAIRIFTKIGDRAKLAFSIDTKSQIFIAKRNYRRAIELADEAIEILRVGDSLGILSECYLTKAIALTQIGEIANAVIVLTEAIQLAKFAGDIAVKKIAESFEIKWFLKFPPSTSKVFVESPKSPDNVPLNLPPEILPNQEFFGVCIKNTDFEKIGLKKGTLALAVKSSVNRGDLVAVSDKATDLVSLGFYENDFGLICLENFADEPILLNENQVVIIGKVVGYCVAEPDKDGRYEVIAIKKVNR